MDICTICHDDLSIGIKSENCECKLIYHESCLKDWYQIKNICPVCKKSNSILYDFKDSNYDKFDQIVLGAGEKLINSENSSSFFLIVFFVYSLFVTVLYILPKITYVFLNEEKRYCIPFVGLLFMIILFIY